MKLSNAAELLEDVGTVDEIFELELVEPDDKEIEEISRKQQSQNRLKLLREIHARIQREKHGQR